MADKSKLKYAKAGTSKKEDRVVKSRSIIKEDIVQSTGGGTPINSEDAKGIGKNDTVKAQRKAGVKEDKIEHYLGDVRRERGDDTMQPRDEHGHFESLALVGKKTKYPERGEGKGLITKRLKLALAKSQNKKALEEYINKLSASTTQYKVSQEEFTKAVASLRSKGASKEMIAKDKDIQNLKAKRDAAKRQMLNNSDELDSIADRAITKILDKDDSEPAELSDEPNSVRLQRMLTRHFGDINTGAQSKLGSGSVSSSRKDSELDSQARSILNKYGLHGTKAGDKDRGINRIGVWAEDNAETGYANLHANLINKAIISHNKSAGMRHKPEEKLNPSTTNETGLTQKDADRAMNSKAMQEERERYKKLYN